jgi:hypothetical protein
MSSSRATTACGRLLARSMRSCCAVYFAAEVHPCVLKAHVRAGVVHWAHVPGALLALYPIDFTCFPSCYAVACRQSRAGAGRSTTQCCCCSTPRTYLASSMRRQPLRDDDPHPRVGRDQDRADNEAAVGAGALPGAGRAHGASRLLLPHRRQRLPRLRRVGLPQHHLRQGGRFTGAALPVRSADSALCAFG